MCWLVVLATWFRPIQIRIQEYAPELKPFEWLLINAVLTLWCLGLVIAANVVDDRDNVQAQTMYIIWNLITTIFWILECGLNCMVLMTWQTQQVCEKPLPRTKAEARQAAYTCSIWIERVMLILAVYFLWDSYQMMQDWNVAGLSEDTVNGEYVVVIVSFVAYAGVTYWYYTKWQQQISSGDIEEDDEDDDATLAMTPAALYQVMV